MKFKSLCVLSLVMMLILGAIPAAAGTPGTLYWAFPTDDLVRSSAAVGADGTIYFGNNNNLYAVNPDGTPKWVFTNPSLLDSSPAIGADGTVYVGGEDGNLYAVTDNGANATLKWAFPTGGTIVFSSPAIGPDGTVYIGANFLGVTPDLDTGKLFAVNPNGTAKWATPFATGAIVYSSPAIVADGTVYIGSIDGNLYAVKPDGSQKWLFPVGSVIDSSPAIGPGGTIYVGADNGKLYAVNPDGTAKWATPFATGGYVSSSPAIGADGTLYVGSADKNLYAVKPDGTLKWAFLTGGVINHSSPAIGADGTVYVGSRIAGVSPAPDTGKLYAITDNGTTAAEKWPAFNTGGWVDSSPAIAADGTVYVGSHDQNLYAVFSDSLGLATSLWPMFHQNLRHTGLSPWNPKPCIVPIISLLLEDENQPQLGIMMLE
jgi:outer membrane protein assembly factor BamB